MNTNITLEKIRHIGYKALIKELGPAGMVKFLQQYETGEGDYSVERHKTLKNTKVKDLAKKIKNSR